MRVWLQVTTAHDDWKQSKNIYYGIFSLFHSVREVAKFHIPRWFPDIDILFWSVPRVRFLNSRFYNMQFSTQPIVLILRHRIFVRLSLRLSPIVIFMDQLSTADSRFLGVICWNRCLHVLVCKNRPDCPHVLY